MAGQFTGMDVGQVRQMAQRLDTAVSELESMVTQLTGVITGTPWVGNDREQFVGEWQGAHTAAIRNVCSALTDAASKARVNADQQEQASA